MNTTFTRAENDFEILNLWLSQHSKLTSKAYVYHARQFLDFVGKELAAIALDDLSLWIRSLELRYKPATVKTKVVTIKSLFTFAYKVGYLPHNIGSLLKTPKERDLIAEKIITEDDVKALIATANKELDRLLLSLMYLTGLRVSESINIRWQDFRGNVLTVTGKGQKQRYVIVPDPLLTQLQTLKTQSDYVFSTATGKPVDRMATHRMIKRLSTKAGLGDKVSAHFLRHSHASHSLEKGCSIRLLQASLGHSSITTTEKYLHINPNSGSSQFLSL